MWVRHPREVPASLPSPAAGDVSIGIKCAPGVVGPTEADIDFDIIRNDNDTFTVKYTPRGAGSYTIMVLFADQVGVAASHPSHCWVSGCCSPLSSSPPTHGRPHLPAPSGSRWSPPMMPAR